MREIRVVQRIGQSYDPSKRVLRFLFFSSFHSYLSSFSLNTSILLQKISSFLKIPNANTYNYVMLVKNHLICFASSLTHRLFENQTYAFRAQCFLSFFSLFFFFSYLLIILLEHQEIIFLYFSFLFFSRLRNRLRTLFYAASNNSIL